MLLSSNGEVSPIGVPDLSSKVIAELPLPRVFPRNGVLDCRRCVRRLAGREILPNQQSMQIDITNGTLSLAF